MKLPRLRFLGQKGQTAMEYLLLVMVAMTIGIAFKKKMEEFVLNNPNSLISRQLRSITGTMNDGSGRYRTYYAGF